MFAVSSALFISAFVASVGSYPSYWSSSTSLNPIHGLYVKPSSDGLNGDLFVASTEDNGVKSQWVVNQPISFLPIAAANLPQTPLLPVPYPGFTTHHDEVSTQKRAVMPNPVPSPKIPYAYAYPVPFSPEIPASKCDPGSIFSHYPSQFNPFQFYYPQFMSAYSNAMTILKDAGLNDDTANSVMSHHPSLMWPPSPYAYPMYVMVNPSTWIQKEDKTTTSTSTSSPSTKEEESSES